MVRSRAEGPVRWNLRELANLCPSFPPFSPVLLWVKDSEVMTANGFVDGDSPTEPWPLGSTSSLY